MKKVLLVLVFGLFFVSFANAQQTKSPKQTLSATTKAEKAAVYQCPMDCEKGKTYDKPGSCPVCKMDLKAKGAAKAKGCCDGKKSKVSCGGSSKKASSCAGEKKKEASCKGESKSKAGCSGKEKASCGSKK
jgi:hypothetical protein